MTALVWDQVGEKIYQTGIDRGVLYIQDGEVLKVVPWNGLISIDESSNSELKSFYLDGVKYLENLTPGDFIGKLKAFTYPDEFELVNGVSSPAPGLSYHEQPSKSFSLSYRTKIGNDVKGTDFGYKIHILYNLLANPDSHSSDTISGSEINATEFSWSLTGTPDKLSKFRPTVHISMDSTKTPPAIWKSLEDALYGTPTTNPYLPLVHDVGEIFGYLGALIIIDNGDGSWSAVDESNAYISMIDPTTFQMDNVDATYTDPDTYQVSSTNVGQGN